MDRKQPKALLKPAFHNSLEITGLTVVLLHVHATLRVEGEKQSMLVVAPEVSVNVNDQGQLNAMVREVKAVADGNPDRQEIKNGMRFRRFPFRGLEKAKDE